MKTLLFALVLLSTGNALAQVERPKPTRVDFTESDPLIGEVQKPQFELICGTKKRKFRNLVEIRVNFRDKLVESARDL